MSTLGLTATGAALEAIDRHLPALLQDRVASRLGAQDADLWGAPARDEAAKRLGWIDLFEDSRALVPHIAQLTRELRAEGVGIVYISHKMDEIKRIADRITVMRDGAHVGTVEAADTPMARIIAMMVGMITPTVAWMIATSLVISCR